MKKQIKKIRKKFNKHLNEILTVSLVWSSALFWQVAINDTIKNFVSVQGAWQYELIVAFFVTIIGAVALFVIPMVMEHVQREAL